MAERDVVGSGRLGAVWVYGWDSAGDARVGRGGRVMARGLERVAREYLWRAWGARGLRVVRRWDLDVLMVEGAIGLSRAIGGRSNLRLTITGIEAVQAGHWRRVKRRLRRREIGDIERVAAGSRRR